MRTRDNRKLIIYALAIMLTITTVAYAALSTTLNIQGTVTKQKGSWKIHFTDLADPVIKGSATSTVNNFEVTYFNFAVTVKKPGDSVVYKFNVKNEGTIDAELYDVQLSGVTEAAEEDIIYTLTYDDTNKTALTKGDTLASGETKPLILTVEFDEDAESLSTTNTQLTLSAMLTYVQSTNSSSNPDVDSSGTVDSITGTIYDGREIYYNPETGKVCDTYTESQSNDGVNTGCMKWYAYGYDETAETNTVNLLLDHNAHSSDVPMSKILSTLSSVTSTWNKNLSSRLMTYQEYASLGGNMATGDDTAPAWLNAGWIYSYDGTSFSTYDGWWLADGNNYNDGDLTSGIVPVITVPTEEASAGDTPSTDSEDDSETWVYSGAIASGNTNGKVVYYDPETAKECTETEYNSNTSLNTGCLKWYAYDEDLNGYTDEYKWAEYANYGTVQLLLSDAIGSNYSWGEEARNGLATETSTWLANLGPRLLSVSEFTKLEGIDGLDVVATGSDYTPVNNWLYATPYWISYASASVANDSYCWNGEGYAIVASDYVSPGSDGGSYGIRPKITVPVRK